MSPRRAELRDHLVKLLCYRWGNRLAEGKGVAQSTQALPLFSRHLPLASLSPRCQIQGPGLPSPLSQSTGCGFDLTPSPPSQPPTHHLPRDSRGDKPPLKRPRHVIHGQPVPAVSQLPLEPEFEHEILGALKVPQAAGGQGVGPLQPEDLALAHVTVAVAAWSGEMDRPPDPC